MRISLVGLALLATVATGFAAIVAELLAQPPLVVDLVSVTLSALTSLLFVVTGTLIEWRRRGHRMGRLLILAGPLFGVLALGWQTAADLRPYLDPTANALLHWLAAPLSWGGLALFTGWIPLLFPTGTLPGPRWRLPAFAIAGVGTAGVIAGAMRPGRVATGIDVDNPFGVAGWPAWLAPLTDGVGLAIAALMVLGFAAVAARYRTGDPVERAQVRWLLAAVGLVAAAFLANFIEGSLRQDDGHFISAIVIQVGLLMMPLAVGVAVLRYRLYEIDRIISRTIGWAIVTGCLLAAFAGGVVLLQAILSGITQGQTLAVAASTLAVFALFQPVRRRVQSIVDRRFDRARYDSQRTVDAFAERIRHDVDLGALRSALLAPAGGAVRPASAVLWLRAAGEREA